LIILKSIYKYCRIILDIKQARQVGGPVFIFDFIILDKGEIF